MTSDESMEQRRQTARIEYLAMTLEGCAIPQWIATSESYQEDKRRMARALLAILDDPKLDLASLLNNLNVPLPKWL